MNEYSIKLTYHDPYWQALLCNDCIIPVYATGVGLTEHEAIENARGVYNDFLSRRSSMNRDNSTLNGSG